MKNISVLRCLVVGVCIGLPLASLLFFIQTPAVGETDKVEAVLKALGDELGLQTYIQYASALILSGFLSGLLIAKARTATGGSTARSGSRSDAQTEAPISSGPREKGQVKWFNKIKGFGFITRDQGDDIFVHFRSIRGQGRRFLREGQEVEFSVVENDKGLQAEDVEVAA